MKTYADIRKIDVSEHIEKKNNLSYLSWAWAVDVLLQNDPDAAWEHPEEKVYPDGTVMVFAVVKAFGKERKAHLPVMDHRNQAIKNPNAFQINTALQRCLVKAIALHGLGLYIYAGEDLPEQEEAPKFDRKDKQLTRDFYYELSQCKTVDECNELKNAWWDILNETPNKFDAEIAQIDTRINGLKNKVSFPPAKWAFVDVEEAIAFTKEANKEIETGGDYLDQWMIDNDHRIKALDEKLTAEKHNIGGKPSARLFKKYDQKFTKPQAAE